MQPIMIYFSIYLWFQLLFLFFELFALYFYFLEKLAVILKVYGLMPRQQSKKKHHFRLKILF
jgi:hypothetical protein